MHRTCDGFHPGLFIRRNTIVKNRSDDPKELSMYCIHQSKQDIFGDSF